MLFANHTSRSRSSLHHHLSPSAPFCSPSLAALLCPSHPAQDVAVQLLVDASLFLGEIQRDTGNASNNNAAQALDLANQALLLSLDIVAATIQHGMRDWVVLRCCRSVDPKDLQALRQSFADVFGRSIDSEDLSTKLLNAT